VRKLPPKARRRRAFVYANPLDSFAQDITTARQCTSKEHYGLCDGFLETCPP